MSTTTNMDEKAVVRRAAIICWNHIDNTMQLAYQLQKYMNVTIFYRNSLQDKIKDQFQGVIMPEAIDTEAKSKNYVIRYYKDMLLFKGKLHVIEDIVTLLKDPTDFVEEVEEVMDILGLNSFLGTVTDVCNHVFQKYNPRFRVFNDKPEWQKWKFKQLVFCSHSNTQWMIFDIGHGDADELTFSEEYKIAMFWIIEYLARRRNTHPGSMYFMNEYVTTAAEEGVYTNIQSNSSDAEAESRNMAAETQIFKSKNIDYSPDNNLDIVLERMYETLQKKLETSKENA